MILDSETNLSDLIQFIQRDLLPHAEAEEDILYKTVDEVTGTPLSTATMRRDHEEIRSRAEQLRSTQSSGVPSNEKFQEAIHEFSAIRLLHFDKQETVPLPVLSLESSEQEFEPTLARVHEEEHGHH